MASIRYLVLLILLSTFVAAGTANFSDQLLHVYNFSKTFNDSVGSLDPDSLAITSNISDGINGFSYEFIGADNFGNFVNLPAQSIDNASNFTLNVWFNETFLNTLNYVFYGVGTHLRNDLSGIFTLTVDNDTSAGTNQVFLSTPGPSLNQWHMATITYNGLNLSFYVDGVIVNSTTVGGPIDFRLFRIGSKNGINFGGWVGFIDELYFWNRTLPPDEVNYLFSGEHKFWPFPGLVNVSYELPHVIDLQFEESVFESEGDWINVTFNTSYIAEANLIYNGSLYEPVIKLSTTQNKTFKYQINQRTNTSNQSYLFNFNYTFYTTGGGLAFNQTENNSQELWPLRLWDVSNTFINKTLQFRFFNELTGSQISVSNFNVSISSVLFRNDQSVSRTHGFELTGTANNLELALRPYNGSGRYASSDFWLFGDSQIIYEGDTFTTRTYYLDNFNFTTEKKFVDLYFLSVGSVTAVTFTLVDSDDDPLVGYDIRILKKQGDGSFDVVQVIRTDFQGKGVADLQGVGENVFYKFDILLNGVLVHSTGEGLITTNTVTLRVPTGQPIMPGYRQTFDILSNLTYNNDTSSFIFNAIELGGGSKEHCLSVVRYVNLDKSQVCNVCDTSVSSTISCSINANQSATFAATGTVTIDGEEFILETLSISTDNDYLRWGLIGLIFAFLLTVVLAVGVGGNASSIALLTAVAATIVWFLKIVYLPWFLLITWWILALFIVYRAEAGRI